MSKILAQWEIDALLNSVSNEENATTPSVASVTERNVKLYDFRRPDKFSKDHIRAIQNVHETYARVTSSTLTSYLRTSATIHLTSIEQVVYDEYVQQLANPTIVNLVELQPLVGRIVVEMGLNLGLGMLDRMMGGTGQVTPRQGHELTDIEFALIRSLSQNLIAGLKDAWAIVSDLQPVLVDTALSADFVQAALPGDIAVLLLLEVQTLESSGTISICIPHPVIEPLMDRLSTQAWFWSSRKTGTDDDRQKVEESLLGAPLDVLVELGTAGITVGELMELREGDVIRLDRPVDAALTVYAGEHARFRGRPGTLSGNRAVQISGVLGPVEMDEADFVEAA